MRIVFRVFSIVFSFLFAFALIRSARGFDPIYLSDFLTFLSYVDNNWNSFSSSILTNVTNSIANFKISLPSWLQWLGIVTDAVGGVIGFLVWLAGCFMSISTFIVYFIRYIFVA